MTESIQIGTGSFTGSIIMLAGGIILPLTVCIWWIAAKKEKVTTVLAGAATWFVFAIILESIPKLIFLNPMTALGKTVKDNVVLFTAVGALLAGLFEETGRLAAFKTVLRKRTNRETGISHGVGHGGFEAIFLLTVSGCQNLVYAALINSGKFQTMIDDAAAAGADVSALEALPAQLAAVTPVMGLISVAERVFAMLMHVALSILVFNAVKRSKTGLYILAIVLHALFDVPAALFQAGALNMYVTEALLAVYAVAFFAVVYIGLYKKDVPAATDGE